MALALKVHASFVIAPLRTYLHDFSKIAPQFFWGANFGRIVGGNVGGTVGQLMCRSNFRRNNFVTLTQFILTSLLTPSMTLAGLAEN